MDSYWNMLRWSMKHNAWVARTNQLTIIVPRDVYERHLQAYFERLGIPRKTHQEIMDAARAEWNRQCELVDRLRQDIQYWLECGEKAIEVYLHQENNV